VSSFPFPAGDDSPAQSLPFGVSLSRMSLLSILAVLAVVTCHATRVPELKLGKQEGTFIRSNPGANERPIIGILSQPGEPAPDGMSYIAASYIKWIEAAGARVVPIEYDLPVAEIRHRFSLVNGLLLPGGGANLSPGHMFYDTAKLLVDLAVESNENGDYFPVHGTCLGLETLAIILSQNYDILSKYDALDAPAPLLYTADAINSRLLSNLPKSVVTSLQNDPIAMENHGKGLSMVNFQASNALSDFFMVVALSLDKKGESYISLMEAKRYPFTASQFHPEKAAFEWTPTLHIPHTPDAIRMSQEIGNFIVTQARRNMHKATSMMEESNVLIYNWVPDYTGKVVHEGEEHDFEQAYYFDGPDMAAKRSLSSDE
jgi:gamma-glutamyl hydrolase